MVQSNSLQEHLILDIPKLLRKLLKKYLLAGLLVWMPLAITIWVLHSVLGLMDGVFGSIITAIQTVVPWEPLRDGLNALRPIRGLGVIVMVAGLLLTGMFAGASTFPALASAEVTALSDHGRAVRGRLSASPCSSSSQASGSTTATG